MHGALAPAHALRDERLDRFGRQPEGKRLGVIYGAESGRVQADRGVQILGDGARREAPDAFE